MDDSAVTAKVEGGTVMGVVGARTVFIENFYLPNTPLPALPHGAISEEIPPCPYPGLLYFGPQDQHHFFGRQAAIERLIEAVSNHGLTALIGASGTGKSSVVLAGLAPRLYNSGNWRFSHFRVGLETDKNPFVALARALAPLCTDTASQIDRLEEVGKLGAKFEKGDMTLATVLGECRARNSGRRILLIADQFEEVFTLVSDDAIRNRFIDLLLSEFSTDRGGDAPDVCLVLTLRADFYGMAVRYRPLSDALQGHVENLGPMTRDELREAIVRPAGAVAFETGLVDTLLDDVTTRLGNLPLLQFALREMWFRQEHGCITHDVYQSIGRVEGALAGRAQEIFDALTNKGDDKATVELFRRLFTRLVTLGQGVEDTRRVVDRGELGDEAWRLAQRLAGEDNRLLVTGACEPGHETAEVVHEALIRNWPTLIDWINRDRAFHTWLRQLTPRLHDWRLHPSDEGTLLRGASLAVAVEWLGQRRNDLSREEADFIDASIRARDERRRREEEVRQQEFRRQQQLADALRRLADEQTARAEMAEKLAKQQRRTTRYALAAAVVLALFALGLLGNSYRDWVETRPWARLVSLSTGKTYDLTQDAAYVGRPAEGMEGIHQVPLEPRRISRLHLTIDRRGRANDWRTPYGTTINGEPLLYADTRDLNHEDIVVLSGLEPFRYHQIDWRAWHYLCRDVWPLRFMCEPRPEPHQLPADAWALLLDGRRRFLPITAVETFVVVGRDGLELNDHRTEGAVLAIRRHNVRKFPMTFRAQPIDKYARALVIAPGEFACDRLEVSFLTMRPLVPMGSLKSLLKVHDYYVHSFALPADQETFLIASFEGLQGTGQITFEARGERFQILPINVPDYVDKIERDESCMKTMKRALQP
jgi:hypothetical protein